ncbi:hypothetical protein FRC02_003542 [Tulasnella sp. 418]|nr:hypothetical protein FRC02_003542 [Tulasnella sp. 418]
MASLANQLNNNLRIATFSIAAFDYLQTLPGEYRLYRKQWKNGRISIVCGLFVVVRYMSILCLFMNGVGFYVHTFNEASCKKFYLVPLMTKLVAGLASNGIIFSRTYAISHNKKTLISLSVLCVLLLPLQILGNAYKRVPVVGTGVDAGNCQAKTPSGDFRSAPYYYLANVIFDAVACSIATVSLLRRSSVNGNLGFFGKKVLKHGLLYAFASTLTNFLVTLALFDVQYLRNIGAFLSVAVTMILAQHLVLATAGIHGGSSIDTSSGASASYNRDRSNSRDPSRNRRIATATIGGTGMALNGTRDPRRTSMTVRPGTSDSRIDHIELGGIRIQTETEIYRTRRITDVDADSVELKIAHGDGLDSASPRDEKVNHVSTTSTNTSTDDLSLRYEAKGRKERDRQNMV